MKHIIFIGFKNTGKSTIGKMLANELKKPFIDLDEKIFEVYTKTPRVIMAEHGEKYFRKLENEIFSKIIQMQKASVVALGGGTAMSPQNRELLKKHIVIQITAPKKIVFERINANGWPAFFPKNQLPFEAFQKLWHEREPVFKKLANVTVKNDGSPQKIITQLLQQLPTI